MISEGQFSTRVVSDSRPGLGSTHGAEIRVTHMQDDDLQFVTRSLNPNRSSTTHRIRMQLQDEDRSAYLIAWMGEEPIAHGMVIWEGPIGSPKQYIAEPCPYIEDLWVTERYRSQGAGRALVKHMETLALARGHGFLGLSVGVDNYRAIGFYSRLGFRALRMPDFELSGTVESVAGEISFWSETCRYMRKSLGLAHQVAEWSIDGRR